MRVYVHRDGAPEAGAVDIPDTDPLDTLLEEEGHVLLQEDTDEPVDGSLTAAQAGLTDRAHVFAGRPRRIKVVVSFNGERKAEEFGPNARVDRVFRWTTGKHGFELSKADAAEHQLALSPGNTVPPGDAHLGSLDDAHPGHLAFALIPKHRYEG